MTSSCGGWSASRGLQPCRTGSAPASGTGRPKSLQTDYPREVIEAALAHVVRNRVEATNARSNLFERRRVLMDDWACYLAQGIGCLRQAQQRDFAPCRPG